MTDHPDHAQTPASALPFAVGGESAEPSDASVPSDTPTSPDATASPDTDALKVLLQAGAAAEALQQQFLQLKQGRAELTAELSQLNADRDAFEKRAREFAEQVAEQRTAHRELTAELEQQRNQLNRRQQDLDLLQQKTEDDLHQLEAKRERLHEAVNSELAREREIMARQRESLDEERARVADRAEQLEQQHADRMQVVEEKLQTERREMRDSVRRELADELEQIQRERQEWRTFKDAEQSELKQQSDDLQQQRELFGEQLEAEHQRLKEEIEKRKQTLLAEQNNLQRRNRFQFEHLARAREDFEEELRDLRREQQLFRSERHRFEEQHRLQFQQLQKIRTAVMQRDASLLREQKVIDRSRVSVELDLKRQQDRLAEHQASVTQDLESRSRQLHQAEQTAAETAQRVEQRLQHVSRMRAELDLQQREILEQRLLLEEMQARAGTGEAKDSPEYRQATKAVESFFAQLHQHLQDDRERLERQAGELTERQNRFRQDRQDLETWFAEQERKLSEQSAQEPDAEAAARITALETELAQLRSDQDRRQRENEVRIRQLLDQIAESESRLFGRTPPKTDGEEQRTAA